MNQRRTDPHGYGFVFSLGCSIMFIVMVLTFVAMAFALIRWALSL